MAMVKRLAGKRWRRQWQWGWGGRIQHGCSCYDWREECDGGNRPWFVCVFVCMERPQKIRSDLKRVNAPWSIARLGLAIGNPLARWARSDILLVW
jgi:hypothetical protein